MLADAPRFESDKNTDEKGQEKKVINLQEQTSEDFLQQFLK